MSDTYNTSRNRQVDVLTRCRNCGKAVFLLPLLGYRHFDVLADAECDPNE